MRILVIATAISLVAAGAHAQTCVINCGFGAKPNPYGNTPANPYSPMGNPYAPNSATNPYAQRGPALIDQNGQYRGDLSANPYAPNSTSNPYGRYGSQYSPDSVNNPFAPKTPVYAYPPPKP